MRPLTRLAFALIATLWPLHSQAAENVTTFTLDNGMDVVVVEDHRAPAVVHMVWYRVGSADEPAGQSGISHFLEHLMFKATENMDSGEFGRIVAENGGSDNAFTSFDYTAYFQRVAADRLGLMMQMEADRMVNLRLTEDEVRTERGVIIEERNQRVENDPGALFREQTRAAQFLNHRYGVPIIGWRHEMENLSRENAKDFYRDFYAPNNAILVVAGDADPAEVRRLAEMHYGVIPSNPDLAPRARSQEPPQTSARRMTFTDPRVAQPYVTRTYLAPERDPGQQEKAAALVMLAEILGGGTTSVLTQALQFDQDLVVYAGAFYSGTSVDDTTFSKIVVPKPGVTLQEAEDAMDLVIEDFLQTGVDAEQLDRIKLQLRASMIYEQDSARTLANRYGTALAVGLTVEDIEAWPDILQAVTAEDIIAAARDVFRPETSVTGWLMSAEEVTQ